MVAKFNFELKIGGRGDIGWGNQKSEFKGWIVDLMTGPEILILDVVMLSSIFAFSHRSDNSILRYTLRATAALCNLQSTVSSTAVDLNPNY